MEENDAKVRKRENQRKEMKKIELNYEKKNFSRLMNTNIKKNYI